MRSLAAGDEQQCVHAEPVRRDQELLVMRREPGIARRVNDGGVARRSSAGRGCKQRYQRHRREDPQHRGPPIETATVTTPAGTSMVLDATLARSYPGGRS